MIRSLYRKFSLREKVMLTMFVWAILLIWGYYLGGRFSDLNKKLSQSSQELKIQQRWLDKEPRTQAEVKEALTKMNPKKTYSKNDFIGRVDALARQSGIPYTLSSPQTRPNDVFQEHTLSLQFKQASLKDIVTFDALIAKESPYLGLVGLKVQPEKINPNNLSVQFDLVALELSNLPNLEALTEESI